MKTENKQLSRRNVLMKLSTVAACTLLAVTAARASDALQAPQAKRAKGAWSGEGVSPSDVIQRARLELGLETPSDITDDVVVAKRRIADPITEGMSGEAIEEEERYCKNYLSRVVINLMETGTYTHARQVDMKFALIQVDAEVSNTLGSLKSGDVDASQARLSIRTAVGYYLEFLEQLPTA